MNSIVLWRTSFLFVFNKSTTHLGNLILMYPMVKKRSVSITAEKQVNEKKRKIIPDSDVRL